MKPIIGVVPLFDETKESYWMLPGYFEGIKAAGALPVMLPLTSESEIILQLANQFDGFLLTGGHDVSPEIYGQKPLDSYVYCPERDKMETLLFNAALSKNMPILGICRGIQFINAVLGGTLYQDLPSQHPSDIQHHQSPPYDVPVHSVAIIENSPLYALLGKKKISVNSYHHQAIQELSPKLRQSAVSEDSLTEAVYMPDKRFVWAVQWHPEFSFKVSDDSMKIFQKFSDECMLYAKSKS